MNTITKYLFNMVGEDSSRIEKLHKTTINRTKTFAIAVHIPLMLWALTAYVISVKIFNLNVTTSVFISGFCMMIIYLVERIVLATPKNKYVTAARILIGLIIATLGASTFDLVIFDKEIAQELKLKESSKIKSDYQTLIGKQEILVADKKSDWLKAQAEANCEANGQCGSRAPSLGPIYKALAKQAESLHKDYDLERGKLDSLLLNKSIEIDSGIKTVEAKSGLLARVEALHQYTSENLMAWYAWLLFFGLVLLFELTVVFSKLVFDETVDDQIEKMKEEVAYAKAKSYVANVTSPVHEASQALGMAYI